MVYGRIYFLSIIKKKKLILHYPPIKSQEGRVPKMFPLIFWIPYCSVKTLFKWRSCQAWKWLNNAVGCRQNHCCESLCWSLDQALKWLLAPSSIFFPLCVPLYFSHLTPYHPMGVGVGGVSWGKDRQYGFLNLGAAYSKASFQAPTSQAATTKPSAPATSAMTEGWQNNHLNNMAELLPRH